MERDPAAFLEDANVIDRARYLRSHRLHKLQIIFIEGVFLLEILNDDRADGFALSRYWNTQPGLSGLAGDLRSHGGRAPHGIFDQQQWLIRPDQNRSKSFAQWKGIDRGEAPIFEKIGQADGIGLRVVERDQK